MTEPNPRLITIGQVARYAGVTVKAVRHYHKRGLLEEPGRDSSGYRRYTAEHAIKLIKIRTLAEAGVPLARIKELLAADPERFAGAIKDIDRGLQQRAREFARTREQLRRLTGGDRLFVLGGVADHLDRLREAGVSERALRLERETWILVQAVSPKDAAILLAERTEAMNDPEFRALYLIYDKAFDWSRDDPRLEKLADRTERWMARRERKLKDGPAPVRNLAIAQLVASSAGPSSPAWQRLTEIARERRAREHAPRQL